MHLSKMDLKLDSEYCCVILLCGRDRVGRMRDEGGTNGAGGRQTLW